MNNLLVQLSLYSVFIIQLLACSPVADEANNSSLPSNELTKNKGTDNFLEGHSTTDGALVGDALNKILGGENNDNFLQANKPRKFSFPRDFGPHVGYRNEWWYLTGNVNDSKGNEFGYQVTFFRVQLQPMSTSSERTSKWSSSAIWMAHVALTDAQSQQHFSEERFSREAAGLAGAQSQPFKVWLNDWFIAADLHTNQWLVKIHTNKYQLELTLRAKKAVVLQGNQGLSQKGPGTDNNHSYYYSLTHLQTDGQLTTGGRSYDISGKSWFDREWSSSLLGKNQIGWDWFALHMNNGEELMYFQVREHNQNNTTGHYTQSLKVNVDGTTSALRSSDIKVKPSRWWVDDEGTRYPIQWQLNYLGKPLTIKPLIEDQTMNSIVPYWEGAVKILDKQDVLVGRGYLELTGYK